jgi:hypothetical protein
MNLSPLEKSLAKILFTGVCAGLGVYMGGLSQTSSSPSSQVLTNPYVRLGLGMFGVSVFSAIVWGVCREYHDRNL